MAEWIVYAGRIATSIILILIGLISGILAKKISYRLLEFAELNKAMAKAKISLDIEGLLSSALMYAISISTLIIVLRRLGVASLLLYALLGLIAFLIVLSSLVSLKDIIPNLQGWAHLQQQHLKLGSAIKLNGIEGQIQRIGYFEMQVRTQNQELLYIPNAYFIKKEL